MTNDKKRQKELETERKRRELKAREWDKIRAERKARVM